MVQFVLSQCCWRSTLFSSTCLVASPASYTGLDNYKSQSALGVSSFPEEINYNQLCSRREIQKHFLSTCTEKCIMRKTQVQSSGYSVLSGGGGRRGRAETLIHIWEAALLAKVGSLLPP